LKSVAEVKPQWAQSVTPSVVSCVTCRGNAIDPVSEPPAETVNAKVFRAPFSEAVTIAQPVILLLAQNAKLADELPLATVTVVGTWRPAFVDNNETAVALDTALANVIVQVPVAPGKTVEGVQESVDNPPGNTSETVADRKPPASVPITTAVCATVNGPAVAENVAVVAFAGTVTPAGVVRSAALLLSVTMVPPAGAVRASVTVQVA
jgi:hypothetical protein